MRTKGAVIIISAIVAIAGIVVMLSLILGLKIAQQQQTSQEEEARKTCSIIKQSLRNSSKSQHSAMYQSLL